MIIEVKQDHINRGIPGCDGFCPVALAIMEQTEFWNVSVGDEEIILNETKYAAPLTVKKFVFNFDAMMSVEPFSFVIAD